MSDKEQCCPKCGGTSGYGHEMTETHTMGARWGETSESGCGGYNVKFSDVKCLDCGAKFRFNSLRKKGLVGGERGER